MRRQVLFLATLLLMLAVAVPAHAQFTGGVITVRDSSTGAVVPSIGDDTNDAIRVNVVAGSSGGPSKVDDAAFTVAVDSVAPIGAMFDNTSTDSVDENDVGVVRMSANRNLFMNIRDAAGNERGANVNASNELLTTASQSGTWTVQPGNTANTTAWLVKELRSATSALSNVSASATNVTCLASNASRLGATIYNDSTVGAFVKFGTTASSTSFTFRLEGRGTLEVPFGYTGIIDCIWDSASGSARVTELSL